MSSSNLRFILKTLPVSLHPRPLRVVSNTYFCRRYQSTTTYDHEEDTPLPNRPPTPPSGENYESLYPGHYPTTLFQKSLLSVGSAVMAITDASRDDMIATLGETTGYYALRIIRRKMLKYSEGRQILQDQPRINSRTVDLEWLKTLPEGTFGKEYSNFLISNRVSPDARLPVHFVDDVPHAYVMQRYRETHDLFHVLLGMPTHMLGEVVVKWVEAFQTGLPMCVMGALAGPVRLWPKQSQKFWSSHLQWAVKTGYSAKFIMAVYYEKHWQTPIEELRQSLNISPPPPTPKKLWKDPS